MLKRTENTSPEQLELLPPTGVPVQFRLSRHTRKLGLEGVAQARAILAAQAARRHQQAVEAQQLAPPRAA
jgi:hypothetical protein